MWLWDFGEPELRGLVELFDNNFVTEIDALVADVNARSSDQLLNLLLRLATEGTFKKIAGFANSRGHGLSVNGNAKGWAVFSAQPVRL